MTEIHSTPTLVERLSDPRPVLAVGTLAWIVATVVVLASGDRWNTALPVCYAGIALGIIVLVLSMFQPRAPRRGRRGAQQGLV